ncbi:MAG: hypothetical protein J2P37_07055, partial [Ktedonobacteraceae bacterium]|nr:hypothetical protein [Ktedonobacteraceae bacterium]
MNPFHGTDRPHDPPQHPSSTDASGLRHLSADLSPVVDHPHADEHPSPHVDLPNAVDHPTTPPSSTETRSQPRQDTGFTIPIDVIAENGEWTSNVKKQWDGFRLERVEER